MTRELPAGARLAAFAGVLVLALGAAYGVGVAAAPDRSGEPQTPAAADAGHGAQHPTAQHPTAEDATAEPLPGLAVSQAGHTLQPATTTVSAGASQPFTFTVTGPDGEPVVEYEPTHERDLHLVVVRRDLTSFQHVHPELAPDGTWTADLDLSAPGAYRAFADFAPEGGEPITLGADLLVPGNFEPVALPAPTGAAAVDGHEVTLAGQPRPGEESELVFTVTREGRPVADLEPYLGAYGHLVALRAGDLAYLHTHPVEPASAGETGGPEVAFGTTFPTAGTYRVFLDFQVDGEVRTAPFTVVVPDEPRAPAPPSAGAAPADDPTPHGH